MTPVGRVSEHGWRHVDAGGRVRCPRRGTDVDLARCLACNWLLDLDRAGAPALRCAAAPPTAASASTSPDRGHVD